MKFSIAAVFGVFVAAAAAQNCWEPKFAWSSDCGRGQCAIEGTSCVCDGCDSRFASSNIACCAG
ncbi:hypothetical protein EsH8_II_000553 [Colletotrichum jinshuiense]